MSMQNIKPYELSVWEEELVHDAVPVVDYIKTTDTEIVADKNYYSYNSELARYTLVETPVAEELEDYYEQVEKTPTEEDIDYYNKYIGEYDGETNSIKITYFKEKKVAVIGSDKLEGYNSAYNIVLKKNKNGEQTLTFSIKYKYYDPQVEQMVFNPFAGLLINERKVKLFYEDKWYDFIIKDHTESSEEFEWEYTAKDAFVLELSKTGYNVELTQELNNNQGTAVDLALRTLEETNWEVINIDLKPPLINEPLYKGTTLVDLAARDMDDDSEVTIPKDTPIYLFYSYIANKNGIFLQFIKQKDISEYQIDSNNNILDKNYRLEKEVVYGDGTISYKDAPAAPIIQYDPNVYTDYQGFRYVYQQLSTYDPVKEHMVKEWEVDGTIIYGYSNSLYTTSDVVVSYLANGSNFSLIDDGSLQGWSRYNNSENYWPEIGIVTYPFVDENKPLISIEDIEQIDGFLEVKFANQGADLNSKSYLLNLGIDSGATTIGSITEGEKFMFRYSGAKSNEKRGALTPLDGNDIQVVVAYYDAVRETDIHDYHNTIKADDIIFHFKGEGEILNNYITGGELREGNYWLDGVIQVPSTQYIYVSGGEEYIWDCTLDEPKYVLKKDNQNKYYNYYYFVAAAEQAVTSESLSDISKHIGVFLYTTDTGPYYYLHDLQLTRYYEDANGDPLTQGNVPIAKNVEEGHYYLAPKVGTDPATVREFATLADLAKYLKVKVEDIKPIYNNGYIIFLDSTTAIFYVHKQNRYELMEQFHVRGYSLEKVLSIEASKSNCFNILQSIAETFECWIDLEVEHNEDGSLYLNPFGQPTKQVFLRNYSGETNYTGFKYGINLNSISRNVNSDEIVTKLIVDPVMSNYTDDGVVTIQRAAANVSGESYIYNFDYFFNQGLIEDKETVQNDLYQYNADMRELNIEINELEQERVKLETSLTKLQSNYTVYETLIETAQKEQLESLDDFETKSGYTYEVYQQMTKDYSTNEESKKKINELFEIDSIADIIGRIYASSAVLNNYRGILTNTEVEYNKIKKQLYGIDERLLSVNRYFNNDDSTWHLHIELDDYIIPFSFQVGEETYEATLNKRIFDIVTNERIIRNIQFNTSDVDGYKLVDAEGDEVQFIIAEDEQYQVFRLISKSELNGIVDDIDELVEFKKEKVKQFNIKYSRFILEGTWSSQDYLSDDLYYLDALQISNVSAHPQVTYTIDVADVSGIEGYEGYVFETGDTTFIEDTEFFGWTESNGLKTPVREQVIVSETEWHLDDPSSNSITVQNYKTRFEDLFQRIQATVQTVQYNEATYVKTDTIVGADGHLNQDLLLDSLNDLNGMPRVLTTDGSISIEGNVILIRDLTNQSDMVKLSNEGISISSDGGATWSNTITGKGINANYLRAGTINTDNITIGNEGSPSFRWDSNGLSAFRLTNQEEGKYDFQKFVRFDQYGLYGIDLRTRKEKAEAEAAEVDEEGDGTAEIPDFVAESLKDVKDNANFALTWDGFFIRNTYTNGWVEITSTDDFRVIHVVNGEEVEKVKIGAIEKDENGVPTKYGITIKNDAGDVVFQTDDDGNVTLSGTMRSDNFLPTGGQAGWEINRDGDAIFNNVSVRGSIKTAVFEYSEIQAVGGAFLFRPSSTIVTAEVKQGGTSDDRAQNTYNLIVTVEQPKLFKTGDYCKISCHEPGGDIDVNKDLSNLGLAHVYPITAINKDTGEITFENVSEEIYHLNYPGEDPVKVAEVVTKENGGLVGGSIISMGDEDNANNYGVGINSSDNYVGLPRRAISLFETTVGEKGGPNKVFYDYTAILGTLPQMPESEETSDKVPPLYETYLQDTQGIYTDNIFFGNKDQYITFYTSDKETKAKELEINSEKFKLKGGRIDATGGVIGGFTLDTNKMYTNKMYFKLFNPGRGYITKRSGASDEIVNNPTIGKAYEYYIAVLVETNGDNTKYEQVYKPLFKLSSGNDYQLNEELRPFYTYQEGEVGQYVEYTDNTPFTVGDDGNFNEESQQRLDNLYQAAEYHPFDYEENPFFSNELALPYSTGMYFSSDEEIIDTDLSKKPLAKGFRPTNDTSLVVLSESLKAITGVSYFKRIEDEDGSYYYEQVDTKENQNINPYQLKLYEIRQDKKYYKLEEDGTTYTEIGIGDITVEEVNRGPGPDPGMGWYEADIEPATTKEHYSIIAGGPITYMRPTNEETQKLITALHTAPTWYFRSDGAARFGAMSLSPDGTLNVPTLATITVDLGTMEQGIIKHDIVGEETGLWISTENVDPNKHIIDPTGGYNYAEQAIRRGGISIANSPYALNWRLIMSNQFGVTSRGVMYSQGARLKDLDVLLYTTLPVEPETDSSPPLEPVAAIEETEEQREERGKAYEKTLDNFGIGLDKLYSTEDLYPSAPTNIENQLSDTERSQKNHYLKLDTLVQNLTLSKQFVLKLPAANWVATNKVYTYDLTVPGLDPNYVVIISPIVENARAYSFSRIKCITQSEGVLRFQASVKPTTDLSVNIIMMNSFSDSILETRI